VKGKSVDTTAFQSREVAVNGFRIHYLEAGKGPSVVLLHGGASDARDWLGTAELASRFRLYAPDIIGYGRSERPRVAYSLDAFDAFVSGFTGTLGLDAPVLVGHSLGGRLGLEAALRHPGMVRRLVLVDAMGFGAVSILGNILGALFWRARQVMRKPQPYAALLPDEHGDTHWTCLERLHGLAAPTLLVWKRYDPYFPLAQAQKARMLIPDVRLRVFPGYGHAPHKQNPQAFNRLLTEFLGE